MVVNDSRFITELLSDLIATPEIKVVSKPQDGTQAIRKLKQDKPDVILLDLEMPNMDGLTFLEKIMKDTPTPTIVVSSYTNRGSQILFDALEYGAVDFVPIPMEDPEKLVKLKNSLILKIKIAARAKPKLLLHQNTMYKDFSSKRSATSLAKNVVVIGASTGGPGVVCKIIENLPADLPAGILIVQHMPESFTKYFAEHLDRKSKLKVKEASNGEKIREGYALLAPGDNHLVVNPSLSVSLNEGPKRMGVRPSINMTMVTASEVYSDKTVGVLLSGMGHDGAFGMKIIKKRGGFTIAQDESSSIIFGMARAAQKLDAVDKFVPAEKIAEEIVRAVKGNA